ncbi:MAG TPA: carbohydrate kinase family protein [Thermomicrobiales bacterium]|nr:carbohydrate kinase family protein [Thermomicrobiales bacterium]
MSHDPGRPLAIVGNLNVDQIVATVHRFPAWDEELIVDSSHLELAGTAGYLALAAKGLGMEPFVVSTVGDDSHGAFLREQLAANDIDDRGVETIRGAATSLGIIFVGDRGQRGILTVLGAHEQMSVAVAARHDARIAACAEVFLCGNFLLPTFAPKHVWEYARRLRERGQVVVFDPSWDPGGWQPQTRAETLALLRNVDLFLPNEEEFCHLTGVTELDEGIAEVRRHAPETQVVIKRGAKGALSVIGDQVIEAAGLPVAAVNTIGAGDVFDVAFLYARRRGWETRRGLDFANAAAACVVAQTGARTYPGEAVVLDFAARHGGG